jgi:NADPH:quinone reductase-like Zn-dependent oxidoreductase
MDKTIRLNCTGGPDVMTYVDTTVGDPGPGEARVRHHAVGLNFLDVYYRSGLYPHELPMGLGIEAAGIVESVGTGVTHVKAGDRVAYASMPLGAYATARVMPANALVTLPDNVSFDAAAAMMLQGLTAQYLLRQTYAVKPGDVILLHAAAGGVGLIAAQWAKHLGATVIGTVSTDAKAELARAHGCDHVIIYSREDVVARVRDITGGEGVPVVYDSVGKDTYETSLACLRPRGLFVSFGNASGPLPLIDSRELNKRGSLYFTRPAISAHTAKREQLGAMATELFDVVASGHVRIEIRQRYYLRDAAKAHRDLEGRATTGTSVLMPN